MTESVKSLINQWLPSVLTVVAVLAVMKNDIDYIKEEMVVVRSNQLELTSRVGFMTLTNVRLNDLELDVQFILKSVNDRYTGEDAERDRQYLVEKINKLEKFHERQL